MPRYKRLSLEERHKIEALRESGQGVRRIAFVLNRSPSSISRELRRLHRYNYRAKEFHQLAVLRRKEIGPKRKVEGALKEQVKELLKAKWSPEQISGHLARKGIKLSHETIYQYIFRNFSRGGILYQSLRRRRKRRRTREIAKRYKNCGKRPLSITWIDQRPEVVEKRNRVGDYERDLVLGKRPGPALLTIVDRTTRRTKIAKVRTTHAKYTHQSTVSLLKALPVHTITNDNGPEFALFTVTARVLNATVFFNHPYSAWERGTNENTNGLIRQYFPKGTDFSKVPRKDIQRVEDELNNRPRKCLGYKTPNEVHHSLSRGVALST